MAIPLMSGLTACNNEDDPNPNPNPNPEPTTTYGAYIVNTGNLGEQMMALFNGLTWKNKRLAVICIRHRMEKE